MRISFIILNAITHYSHHQETNNTLNNNLKINIGERNHIHGNGFHNLFLFDVYFVNFFSLNSLLLLICISERSINIQNHFPIHF